MNNKNKSFYKRVRGVIKNILPPKLLVFFHLMRRRLVQRRQWYSDAVKKGHTRRAKLRFDIHLAEHCNLYCRGCEHFSPLAPKKLLDIAAFKRDCERIVELTSGDIEDICFVGGEPLLHPKLTEIIDTARSFFPNARFWMVTNGTLLLKQSEEFWLNLQRNRVELSITVYPVNLDIKTISSYIEKYNIGGGFGNEADIEPEWVVRPLDINGKQSVKGSWEKCYQANNCIQLTGGKLFPCARAAYINYFNGYFNQNLEISENDYIDLYKAHNIDEILDFLSKPIPFCRYCNLKKTIWDVKWSKSEKKIEEWTL